MNRLRWAPWKESAVSTSHEHIEGLSSIVPTSCHREGGIVQNSSGRIIFLNPPKWRPSGCRLYPLRRGGAALPQRAAGREAELRQRRLSWLLPGGEAGGGMETV